MDWIGWTLGGATVLLTVPILVYTITANRRSKERRDFLWSVGYTRGVLKVTNDGLDDAFEVTIEANAYGEAVRSHIPKLAADQWVELAMPKLASKRQLEDESDEAEAERIRSSAIGRFSGAASFMGQNRSAMRFLEIDWKISWRSRRGTWDMRTGRSG